MEILSLLFEVVVSNAPFLVGFVLPPLVEVINKDVKKEWERFVITLVICLFTGTLLHWKEIASGNPETVLLYSAAIFAESQLIFKLYFAKSWVRGAIRDKVGSSVVQEELKPEAEEAMSAKVAEDSEILNP